MKLIKQEVWREHPENILAEFLENDSSISVIDVLGRVIYSNKKFADLIEIPHDKIGGELNTILKSDRHANPLYKDLWAVIKSGQIWKGILSDYTSSGKLYKLDTTIIPGRDCNGEINKFVAFYFKVKPKHEAKSKAVGSENKANSIYNGISNSVISINVFAEIKNSNRGLGKLNEKEVLGRSLYSFISPIYHDMVKKTINKVFNDAKPNQFETIGTNSDGDEVLFVSQIGPVLNNKGIVVSATISTHEVKDISEVKQELIENEAKYHAIFQSMKVGIIVIADEEGKITEWNKGAELAFGYTEREIKGEYLTKLVTRTVENTNIIELLNAVKTLIDFNENDTIEMKGYNKSGVEFPVEFSIKKWKNGSSNFYCAMMQDLTKRKNLKKPKQHDNS